MKRTGPPATLATVPGVQAWRAMTPAQRLDFQLRVLDALSDPIALMSEGRPHKKAKSRALDALNLHFRSNLHFGNNCGRRDLLGFAAAELALAVKFEGRRCRRFCRRGWKRPWRLHGRCGRGCNEPLRRCLSDVEWQLRTMVRSHAFTFDPRSVSNPRYARRIASCTRASASSDERDSHRANR